MFSNWARMFASFASDLLRQVADKLQVEVHSHSDSGSEDSTIAFSYIPKYLFYIVQEWGEVRLSKGGTVSFRCHSGFCRSGNTFGASLRSLAAVAAVLVRRGINLAEVR